MKKKDLDNLKSKTPKQIDGQLEKERGELLNLKIDLSLGKIKNTRAIKMKKQNIAQILTIVRENQPAKNG